MGFRRSLNPEKTIHKYCTSTYMSTVFWGVGVPATTRTIRFFNGLGIQVEI